MEREDAPAMALPRKGTGLAKTLGWVSLGIGAAEVLGASAIARTFGAEQRSDVAKAYGIREIATGLGILASDNPAPWIWARICGDAVDLGTLAAKMKDENPKRQNVKFAMASVAGIMAADLACAWRLSKITTPQNTFLESYAGRRGMPKPPEQMRGLARDFKIPEDMRVPAALRPFKAA